MSEHKQPVGRRAQPPPPRRSEPPSAALQKKKIQTRRRLTTLLAGLFIMLVFAWILMQMAGAPDVPTASSTGNTSGNSSLLAGEPASGVDDSSWDVAGPISQAENAPLVTPDYRMIALPENGRVDAKYFDTVTFVGDSITQGLGMYEEGIPNAHYCAYKSISPKGIYDGSTWPRLGDKVPEVPIDAIVESQPDNVYILLGANAIGGTQDDALIEYYRTMLNTVKERLLPGVGIYIQSITPVGPKAKFSMERINELNNRLAQLAYEEGVYFLDLNEPLAGDDGFLRADFASPLDDIHMTPAGYAAWVDYLVTHTAYHPRNPYLTGSPYYTPPALPASSEAA